MRTIPEATGASVRPSDFQFEKVYRITDFGAGQTHDAVRNTAAINEAIARASAEGGARVIVPAGEFRCYTIRLKSHVHLFLEEDAVIRAAVPQLQEQKLSDERPQPEQDDQMVDTRRRDEVTARPGEGGNYDEPEVNLMAGLQDHGHSYFANSLIYAADEKNIMISGKGLIDGSSWNEQENCREFVLQGGDPVGPQKRTDRGHGKMGWFGNKAIALVRCENVVLCGFSLLIGGHFAMIAEGVKNFYCEDLLVDTNRDAFDIDCCQDVTVKNSWFNSLTDDALVLKSSFGAGKFMPLKNVRIEDCKVTGYDAGSVCAKTFTGEKLVAEDRCGPTARIKFGTEASCGGERITIERTSFEHSRGLALEAVDGSDLKDIIFRDCVMKKVSSSPIFIRVGDRCRFPVTGMHTSDEISAPAPNVRLDNPGFVIPDAPAYERYPAVRCKPSYNRDKIVSIDGISSFAIVNPVTPLLVNEANYTVKDGRFYAKKYVAGEGYVTDWSEELTEREAMTRGNACASPMAKVSGVLIENLKAEDVDPRYPIILMGLDGSCVEDVCLKNIDITWRGGLSLKEAVEQRQVNTDWTYCQYLTKPATQNIPWLVNTFFLKNEGLLPRADWDEKNGCWIEDPYNVPELPDVYPEPSNWGILPAYGFYARHVRGLCAEGLCLHCEKHDGRHAIVLDDVENAQFSRVKLDAARGMEDCAAADVRQSEAEKARAVANCAAADVYQSEVEKTRGTADCAAADAWQSEDEKARAMADRNAAAQQKAAGAEEAEPAADVALVTNLYKRPAGFEYVPDMPYHMTSVAETALPAQLSVKLATVAAPAPGTPRDSFWPWPAAAIPENGYHFDVPTQEYPLPKTVYPQLFPKGDDTPVTAAQAPRSAEELRKD